MSCFFSPIFDLCWQVWLQINKKNLPYSYSSGWINCIIWNHSTADLYCDNFFPKTIYAFNECIRIVFNTFNDIIWTCIYTFFSQKVYTPVLWWQEWWDSQCRGIVYLGTQSTQRQGWNQTEKVNKYLINYVQIIYM